MEIDKTQIIERINQIIDEVVDNPIGYVHPDPAKGALNVMLLNKYDYIKTSCVYQKNEISVYEDGVLGFQTRIFDAPYGIQIDVDCDITLQVGTENVFKIHCPKDVFVLFPFPVMSNHLYYRGYNFVINNIEFKSIQLFGILFDNPFRQCLGYGNFVMDRFYFINGQVYNLVNDPISIKYDYPIKYDYLSNDFDYSKKTNIDTFGKKWYRLQSFDIRKSEMKRVIERNSIIQEELVEKIWNPLRIQYIADQYDIPFTNLIDIYA